jgi:hypothetical protein
MATPLAISESEKNALCCFTLLLQSYNRIDLPLEAVILDTILSLPTLSLY